MIFHIAKCGHVCGCFGAMHTFHEILLNKHAKLDVSLNAYTVQLLRMQNESNIVEGNQMSIMQINCS